MRKKNRGDGAIGFGDDPKPSVRQCAIDAENSETMFEAELIFLAVVFVEFSTFPTPVAGEKFSGRCDDLSKRKQRSFRGGFHLRNYSFLDLGFLFPPMRRRAAQKKQMPFMARESACRPRRQGRGVGVYRSEARALAEEVDGPGAGFSQEGHLDLGGKGSASEDRVEVLKKLL